MDNIHFTPIGHVQSSIKETLHPEQMRAVPSSLVLEEQFKSAVDALQPGEWIWVIYHLHRIQPDEKIAMQDLFVRRRPRRPNPIGITLVQVKAVHGTVIDVSGLDACDGSPILDLKPWRAWYDTPFGAEEEKP